MTNLAINLQKTISNLENIRDSQDCPNKELTLQLDKLYQLQLELVSVNITLETQKYKIAEAAMEEAAKATKETIDGIMKIEKAIEKVADATGKVAPLLAQIL